MEFRLLVLTDEDPEVEMRLAWDDDLGLPWAAISLMALDTSLVLAPMTPPLPPPPPLLTPAASTAINRPLPVDSRRRSCFCLISANVVEFGRA